jgi:Raf kinase inhibitor-like YbhB/YbcL family protein
MLGKSHTGHGHEAARPWLGKLIYSDAELKVPEVIRVESVAFDDGAAIPPLFTADGEKDSPPLRWRGVPDGAAAIVLVVEDPDSPTPAPFIHGVVIKSPGRDDDLIPGALAREGAASAEGLLFGLNSRRQAAWTPPDPPAGHGPHRYVFQVFAIDHQPEFDGAPDKHEILGLLRAHALAKGCVTGIYERAA